MQAGGTVQSNVDRWIGQFGAEAKPKSKTTKKKIANFEVTIVEAEGTYGGEWAEARRKSKSPAYRRHRRDPEPTSASGITGPKTVQSARAALDSRCSPRLHLDERGR